MLYKRFKNVLQILLCRSWLMIMYHSVSIKHLVFSALSILIVNRIVILQNNNIAVLPAHLDYTCLLSTHVLLLVCYCYPIVLIALFIN